MAVSVMELSGVHSDQFAVQENLLGQMYSGLLTQEKCMKPSKLHMKGSYIIYSLGSSFYNCKCIWMSQNETERYVFVPSMQQTLSTEKICMNKIFVLYHYYTTVIVLHIYCLYVGMFGMQINYEYIYKLCMIYFLQVICYICFSGVKHLGYNACIEHRHNYRFFKETITDNKTSSNICDVSAVVTNKMYDSIG